MQWRPRRWRRGGLHRLATESKAIAIFNVCTSVYAGALVCANVNPTERKAADVLFFFFPNVITLFQSHMRTKADIRVCTCKS